MEEEASRLCGHDTGRGPPLSGQRLAPHLVGAPATTRRAVFCARSLANLVKNLPKRDRKDLPAAPTPRRTLSAEQIGPGDRVRHDKWGLGTVRALTGEGDKPKRRCNSTPRAQAPPLVGAPREGVVRPRSGAASSALQINSTMIAPITDPMSPLGRRASPSPESRLAPSPPTKDQPLRR